MTGDCPGIDGRCADHDAVPRQSGKEEVCSARSGVAAIDDALVNQKSRSELS